MKKTLILSSAFLALMSSSAYGQAWNVSGGTVNTYTNDNVGIGSVAIPTDANLHIHNFWGSNFASGCTGVLPITYIDIPAVKIDDKRLGGYTIPFGMAVQHNIFEIWHHDYLCTFGTAPVTRMSFVVNDGLNGTLVGINKAAPASTLDVGGAINADATIHATGNISTSNSIHANGNVNADNILSARGGLLDMTHGSGATNNFVSGSTNGWLGILSGSAGGAAADGAYLQMFGNSSVGGGSLYLVASGTSAAGTTFYYQPSGSSSVPNMTVRNDGKVIIGPGIMGSTPTGYKLYVAEGILTEKLKVANSTDPINWADYVFDDSYELRSLGEVESFIKSNKHLPEIPSASEVAKDGLDIVEIDAKLLQKIEELTLYAIQQQKQIDKQQKEIEVLKKKIK